MRKEVKWFEDSIIYQVFIDRFAGVKKNGDSKSPIFCGGNIKALTNKLPYFKELGVNTLLISPFMEGSAYHGYHITDFFEVDPHFGSIRDVENFILKAHTAQIKVILDLVPNHLFYKHPFFLEATRNENSKYRNWFYFDRKNNHLSFLQFKDLVKLNLDYPPSRDYVLKYAKFWLDKGFDGLRLDHVAGPSLKFWKFFAREINKHKPEAVLIGEMWTEGWKFRDWNTLLGARFKIFRGKRNYKYIKDYIGILDGCLDFEANKIFRSYAGGKITLKILKNKLKKHYGRFPKDFFLPLFLDNHDMERILFVSKQKNQKLKELVTLQFKIPQPKIIYYGTEVGMTQFKPFSSMKSHGDLLARQPMEWEKKGNSLFEFYKKIIKK